MENRPGQNVIFYCSICLFGDNRQDKEETVVLTVINGQMVCEEHTGYVQGGDHAQALAVLGGIKRD